MKEYFRQPIVDTFDMRVCMSKSVRHVVDFQDAEESDLHRIGKDSLCDVFPVSDSVISYRPMHWDFVFRLFMCRVRNLIC